jgi:hypothetical protein
MNEAFDLEILTETVSAMALPMLPRSSRTVIGRPSRIRSIAAGQSSWKDKNEESEGWEREYLLCIYEQNLQYEYIHFQFDEMQL